MKYGRYEVIELLGSGSMGDVYKAYDPQFDRNIALKVLKKERVVSDDYVRRFMRGAAAVGRLSHGNIGAAYDIGQEHGTIYIAMELLSGTTLKQQMADEKIGELTLILKIAKQVAKALHYAHQNGVIHRDIKPENIVCSSKHEIKVTDFGIAHIDDPDGQQMTQEGEVLGTPYYMSPEQFEGRPVDGRSDLYSLGVILYELTTGQRPFQGKSFKTLYVAVTTHTVREPHILNTDVPIWFSKLIMKAMAREPSERYSSGSELIRAIEDGEKNNQMDDGREPSAVLITFLVVLILGAGAGTAYYMGYIPSIASFFGDKVKPQEEKVIDTAPGKKDAIEPVDDQPEIEVAVDSPEEKDLEATPAAPATEVEIITQEAPIADFSKQPEKQQEEVGVVDVEGSKTEEKVETEFPDDKMFTDTEEEDSIWNIEKDEQIKAAGQEQSIVKDTKTDIAEDDQRTDKGLMANDTGTFQKSSEPDRVKERSVAGDNQVLEEIPVFPQDTSQPDVPVRQEEEKTASLTHDEGLWKNVSPETDKPVIDSATFPASGTDTEIGQEESEPTIKTMVLNSRPEGAQLFIDGNFFGKTPVQIEVSADKHEIELKLAGHGELKAQVDFSKIKKKSHTFRIPSL